MERTNQEKVMESKKKRKMRLRNFFTICYNMRIWDDCLLGCLTSDKSDKNQRIFFDIINKSLRREK